jgi:hypothetical protein
MKELDAKLEEVNKQQAAVSEQKMLLDIKNQELETQKSGKKRSFDTEYHRYFTLTRRRSRPETDEPRRILGVVQGENFGTCRAGRTLRIARGYLEQEA